MKYMKRLIGLTAGIMLCFSSCDEPFDSAFRAYTEDPISLYLEAQPEFSDWVAVLKKTGYFNSLNLTSIQSTHFAVKNGPLKEYARSHFGVDDILDVELSELQGLVKYHTIPNYKISARNMNGKIPRRTALKTYLTAVYDPVEKTRYILNGDDEPSLIIEPDIDVTNGYIHVLNTPLVTEFKNLMQVLESRVNDEGEQIFSIFIDALKHSGLDQYLENESVDFVLGPDRLTKNAQEEKTVFAVTNEAFNEYDITDYESLKRYLDAEVGFSEDPSSEKSHFWQFVAYHIVPKRLSYSDLALFPIDPLTNDGSRLKRKIIYPYNTVRANMRGLCIEDQLSGLVFNPHVAPDNNSFQILPEMRDIPASNGYIQVINNIMLKPNRMAFFPVEYEPTDEMQFKAIDFYQNDIAAGVAAETFEIVNGDVPTLYWTEYSADTKVWYSNVWMDNGRFLNNDALYFTLGSVGNIDIQLPPMPMTGNDRRYSPYVEKGTDAFLGGKYAVSLNRSNLDVVDFKTGPKLEKWRANDIRFGTEDPPILKLKVGEFGGQAGIDRIVMMPAWSGTTAIPKDYPVVFYDYWDPIP